MTRSFGYLVLKYQIQKEPSIPHRTIWAIPTALAINYLFYFYDIAYTLSTFILVNER